ncbi:MAG: hypothetical protein ACE5R6_00010 [Candidatus Heimdallarchaeota archaeon]
MIGRNRSYQGKIPKIHGSNDIMAPNIVELDFMEYDQAKGKYHLRLLHGFAYAG